MIATSRYRQVMYRAQKLLQKHRLIRDNAPGVRPNHHQIQDGTPAVLLKHCQIQDGTPAVLLKQCQIQRALSKQDCEHVHVSDNFVSRYAPLNFINMQRVDETRCFRVRFAIPATSPILSLTWMSAHANNPFLTTRKKEHYRWREVWLFLRTGQQHCFRGVKNGIREVACA